jgi:ribose-phosphate pyrophosphokinase
MAGGSVLKQVDILYNLGAEGKAYFAVTHPVMLPSAYKILDEEHRVEKIVTTNTIPIPRKQKHPKIEVISVASLLADIISRIHRGISISEKLVLS